MAKVKNETTEVVTETAIAAAFDAATYIKEAGSVSAAIRKLAAEGMARGTIAKNLGKRYQHVRNVLITPGKKLPAGEKAAAPMS